GSPRVGRLIRLSAGEQPEARRARIGQPDRRLIQDIHANLEAGHERLARARERAGRKPDDVLLIAVSKTVEIERIRLAVTAGVQALGENRVQEAKDKVAAPGGPVPWHLIASLPTQKAQEPRG